MSSMVHRQSLQDDSSGTSIGTRPSLYEQGLEKHLLLGVQGGVGITSLLAENNPSSPKSRARKNLPNR